MAQTFADRYESVLVPVIFVPWAQELIRHAPPQSKDRILDLGCGTGVVTRQIYIAGYRPARLTGADHSAEMLSVARELSRREEVPADWHQADAGALPFKDASFDLAYCQQAFQFFPDKAGALRDLRRVLARKARVAMCVQADLSLNPMLKAQAETLETHVGPAAGAAVRAICGLPDAREIHDLFKNAGFKDIEIEQVSLTLSHPDGRAFASGAMGGMHTGDKIGGLDKSAQDRSVDAFLNALGDCYDGTAIRFPHVSHVITARN